MSSSKIKQDKENPIDVILLKLSDQLNNIFYCTNHSPNMITTYSFICGLISCYFLYKGNINMFAFLFFISYFFDVCDGNYARKYEMVTEFGDTYDHFTDVAVFIILTIIIISKYYNAITIIDILIFTIALFIMLSHMGCQQHNCKHCSGTESLDSLKCLCLHKKHIRYTKYGGVGSFILFFIIFVYYLNYKNKNKF
jgi:phosphatidylglycerophosphate synthase